MDGGVTINATTDGSSANYAYCSLTADGGPPAADVVYALTLPSAGVLSVAVTAATGSALVPTVDVRSDCGQTPVVCASAVSGAASLTTTAVAGTYYVIVSGAQCTLGAFTLTATLTAAPCGNGVVDPGEQCDPGPTPPPNDGCGAPGTANQCQFIAAPTSEDVCPGQSLVIPVGTTILPESEGMSTYGFTDNYIGSCSVSSASPPNGGLDRVFQLTPAASGTLTVSVGYQTDGVTAACDPATQTGPDCWFSVLYARTTCATASSEVANACAVGADGTFNVVPAQISFPVLANTPYWVFVDGYDAQNYSYGPFNFIVSLQ